MDFPDPSLLPKGILTNTSTVYDEVAGYSVIPADKVHKYWHVYTITNKKLKDPTARRLENFWWHVWGSDRGKLSGRVLAKIFEDISLGPTVVPLRGPANRWEGPDAAPLTIETIMAHLQNSLLMQADKPPASDKSKTTSPAASTSSLRPSQLPPILKKIGSSSTNSVRNTARFVSPHESAEEDTESDALSSGSTLANESDASQCVMNSSRVNSTQTSASKASSASLGTSKRTSNGDKYNSTASDQVLSRHGEDGSLANGSSRSDTRERRQSKTQPSEDATNSNPRRSSKLSGREKIVLGKQPMRRQSSSKTLDRSKEPSMPQPKRPLFTGATASTTNVAAQGTIIDQAGSVTDLPRLATSHRHHGQEDETSPYGGSSTSSPLESRLTPTQPSSSTVLPLGRTKSQLTLLLEREKERSRS